MSALDEYKKMLENGSASKPIKISQPTPENPDGGIGGSVSQNASLGESKEDTSWQEFDSQMQEYKKTRKPKKQVKSKNESNIVKKLERRIVLLEGIVEQIMKTQMDLLKNG